MIRYPGGKSKLSHIIISKIRQKIGFMDDKKDTYVEPFFGGGSIGLEIFKSGIISKICINIKDVKGAWLLSYDDCKEIRKLYDWAGIEKIDVNYSIGGSTKKSELLIYN
jgi:site-specific DNA-adenine methylase